jgi:NitT/TauT family transport system substrate-binding protein
MPVVTALRRLSPLVISLAALLTGCAKKDEPSSDTTPAATRTKIVVQLDWVPEPEHGGFFQAQARGWFAEAGLDVELVPGGANAFGPQKVATNQAQIGQSDSTSTLLAIAEGLPLVHVGAVFQNDPSVLMLHADNPVASFEELRGKTVMARPEWVFLPYLKKKYGFIPNIVPQNFQVGNFIADKNFIQQGFYIAEPFHIINGGAMPPKFLYVWDAGFDAYTALYANKIWARENGLALKAFLAAYVRGWDDYLNGDPSPGQAALKAANPNNTDAFLAWSREKIKAERLVSGRDAAEGDISRFGRITVDRFAGQLATLVDLGLVPEGKLKPADVMTEEYLPVAPTP